MSALPGLEPDVVAESVVVAPSRLQTFEHGRVHVPRIDVALLNKQHTC